MALSFASAGTDKVDCGSAAVLDNLDPFTVVMWMDNQNTGTTRVLCTKATTTSNGWRIIFGSGDGLALIVPGTSNWTYDTPNSTIGTGLQMLAIVFDSSAGAGSQGRLYRGTPTATVSELSYNNQTDGSGQADDSGQNLEWCNLSAVGNFSVGADVSRVALFSSALSLTDLIQLQYGTLETWMRYGPVNLLEMGLWGGTGTQQDLSGNGGNGTVTGATVADHAPIALYSPMGQPLTAAPAFDGSISATLDAGTFSVEGSISIGAESISATLSTGTFSVADEDIILYISGDTQLDAGTFSLEGTVTAKTAERMGAALDAGTFSIEGLPSAEGRTPIFATLDVLSVEAVTDDQVIRFGAAGTLEAGFDVSGIVSHRKVLEATLQAISASLSGPITRTISPGSWAKITGDVSVSWGDKTFSDTTNRNTSRFVLYNRSNLSVDGGIDFGVHIRSTGAKGRGSAFLVTAGDPVKIYDSGDSII